MSAEAGDVGLHDDLLAGPEPDVDAKPFGERLSLGVAARLSRYLQVLTQARKMGKDTISSQELSDYTHINSTQIRRDLSGFGKFGKRGVGYNVDSLVSQIRKILRTTGRHNIALFGAGHLGQAIAGSEIFGDHGFKIVAIFDTDEKKVGNEVSDSLTVTPYEELERVVKEEEVVVGVLAVPTDAAQKVADDLVQAGVRIIFNYSEALLQVPPEVTVHTSSPAVDLLYALYFYLTCALIHAGDAEGQGGLRGLERLHGRARGGVRDSRSADPLARPALRGAASRGAGRPRAGRVRGRRADQVGDRDPLGSRRELRRRRRQAARGAHAAVRAGRAPRRAARRHRHAPVEPLAAAGDHRYRALPACPGCAPVR